jgi:hypothetical protein
VNDDRAILLARRPLVLAGSAPVVIHEAAEVRGFRRSERRTVTHGTRLDGHLTTSLGSRPPCLQCRGLLTK